MRNQNSSLLLITAFALIFSGCTTPEMGSVNRDGVKITADISSVSRYEVPTIADIRVMALDSDSTLLGEAVANEFSTRGSTVIKASELGKIFAGSGLTEIEVTQPQNMKTLKAEGIDAYLIIQSTEGNNKLPKSVTAWLIETATGKIVAEATWQNRSTDDSLKSDKNQTMNEVLGDVAKQLADELGKAFGFSG
jgi:hypothetical protein